MDNNNKEEIACMKDQIDSLKNEIDALKNVLASKQKEIDQLKIENQFLIHEQVKKAQHGLLKEAKSNDIVIKNENNTTKIILGATNSTNSTNEKPIAPLLHETLKKKSSSNGTSSNTHLTINLDAINNSLLTPPLSPMSPLSPFTPPPPPPPPPLFESKESTKVEKNVPKSTAPMRAFNWSKIPQNKFENTLWKNVNEEAIYQELDLDEFTRYFSINQQVESNYANSEMDNNHPSLLSESRNRISNKLDIIDRDRAHLCGISFRGLKIQIQDLVSNIYSMDYGNRLTKDNIEQLLKIVPTPEEASLLKEYGSEAEGFNEAYKFLYQMSIIFRYQRKLECLNFKKKYLEPSDHFENLNSKLISRIDKYNQFCVNLLESKNLVKLLEIVLCLGNYMNQNHYSGDALGFSVSNLKELANVKSTTNKSFSLMHFVVSTIESKVNI